MKLRLSPLETVSPGDCRQEHLSTRTFECGTCGKHYAEGAVVTGPVEYDPEDQLHFRHRKLFCDHCHHIMHWQQVCWSDGRLRGLWKSEPGYIRDNRKIAQFLLENPQAQGVE